MTDEVQNYRGTASYTRHLNNEARGGLKYENEDAFVSVQFDVVPDDDEATILAAKKAMDLAKYVVLQKLGVDFEIVDGSPVETLVTPVVSDVAVVNAAFPGATAAPARAAADSNGSVVCPDCGGPTWDNRKTKKKPTQPDYRCKAYNDDPPCEGVVWPERKGR